jgi:hypothetical protein
MSDDGFTANRLRWIEQVLTDSQITPFARVVGAIVATRYLNRETGEAWPSHDRLGRDCGGTPEGVRKAILALEGRGYLAVERSKGRSSNRYRLLIRANHQPPLGVTAAQPQTPVGGHRLQNTDPQPPEAPTPNSQSLNPQPPLGRTYREPSEKEPVPQTPKGGEQHSPLATDVAAHVDPRKVMALIASVRPCNAAPSRPVETPEARTLRNRRFLSFYDELLKAEPDLDSAEVYARTLAEHPELRPPDQRTAGGRG